MDGAGHQMRNSVIVFVVTILVIVNICLWNSHEFIRQTGIPAHPCLTEVTLAREEALVATIDFMEGLLMPLAMLLLKVRILIDKVLNSKIVLIKLYKVSF